MPLCPVRMVLLPFVQPTTSTGAKKKQKPPTYLPAVDLSLPPNNSINILITSTLSARRCTVSEGLPLSCTLALFLALGSEAIPARCNYPGAGYPRLLATGGIILATIRQWQRCKLLLLLDWWQPVREGAQNNPPTFPHTRCRWDLGTLAARSLFRGTRPQVSQLRSFPSDGQARHTLT